MSSANKNSGYGAFIKAFIEAHLDLSKQSAWKHAKAMLSKIKPVKGDWESLNKKMSELKLINWSLKSKNLSFWTSLKWKPKED